MPRTVTCLLLALLAAPLTWADVGPAVPVPDPGFEDLGANGLPAAWSADGQAFTSGTDSVRSGARSLRYENQDPNLYIVPSATLPLEVGRRYEISVWVKTEDLKGDDTGATVCVEWSNTAGEWAGGYYPAGLKGTNDWKLLTATTGPIAPEAASCHLACYVRKGMTGKAWFDDVTVSRVLEPPLQTAMLLDPNYRGLLGQGPGHARVKAQICLSDAGLSRDQVRVELILQAASGDVARVVQSAPATDDLDLDVSTADLPPGAYALGLRLVAAEGGRVLGSRQWPLRIVPSADLATRTAYIDSHNRVILNGKPFFPLGMYWGSISFDDIQTFADSPFNCLMPYTSPTRVQMDLAQANGLKVIYSVKDAYAGSGFCVPEIQSEADERPWVEGHVQEFRDHPALLGWYLNDELSLDYLDRLKAHQQWVTEADPNHPTWVVLYQVNELAGYADTFDVIGTDPYPIPGSPASMAGQWAQRSVDTFDGRRPVWMVPQVFNWATYRAEGDRAGLRPPTLEEMRSMAWQCITAGARGLIFYSWFDIQRDTLVPFGTQWPLCKQMAAEIRDMEPVILSVEPTPPVQYSGDEAVRWTTRKVGDTLYVIAVNSGTAAAQGTFTLDRAPAVVRLRDTHAPVAATGADLPVDLPPLGVSIYEIGF
jgi:hypothetical protein